MTTLLDSLQALIERYGEGPTITAASELLPSSAGAGAGTDETDPSSLLELLMRMDPDEISRQNNAARGPGHDDELISLAALHGKELPAMWSGAEGRIVLPPMAAPTPLDFPSEIVYYDTLEDTFPGMIKILRNANTSGSPIRFVVAGGMAASPLFKGLGTGSEPSDCDVFVVAPETVTETQLWTRLHHVTNAMLTELKTLGDAEDWIRGVDEILADGVLTVRFFYNDPDAYYRRFRSAKKVYEVQFILRKYPDVGTILHGFDIPSAAIATDGEHVWLTVAAAASHRTGVTLADPSRRSTTFERRLAKYVKKGHGLLFVGLPEPIEAGRKYSFGMEDNPCRLAIKDITELMSGALTGTIEAIDDHALNSGYAAEIQSLGITHAANPELSKPTQLVQQGAAAMKDLPRINLKHLMKDNAASSKCVNWGRSFRIRSTDDLYLPFKLNITRDRLYRHIVSRAVVEQAIRSILKRRIDGKALVQLLGVPKDAALDFIKAHIAAELDQDKSVNWHAALGPVIERVRTRHLAAIAAGDEGRWWIVTDPGRQWTASWNPTPAEPADWYKAPSEKTEETEESEEKTEELPALGTTCSICFETLTPGSQATVVTDCRHVFHFYSQGRSCDGLAGWMKKKGDRAECPVCRKPLNPVRVEETVVESEAVLDFDWTGRLEPDATTETGTASAGAGTAEASAGTASAGAGTAGAGTAEADASPL